MKLSKLGALFATSVLVLTGCSDENSWMSSKGEGSILPRVIADNTVKEVIPITRAEEQVYAPDASEFSLKLSKPDGTYDRSWETVGMFPADETFPMGAYKMEAFYGDLSREGFDCPYFYGSEEFIVEEGETTEVNITASLANSMVSIDYTDEFKQFFKNYSVQAHTKGGRYVDFCKDEPRPAYMRPGMMSLIVHLEKQNGVAATFQPADIQIDARHHYHITMDVNNGEIGDAQLVIKFDDSIVKDDVVVNLSDELMLSPEPELNAVGFEHNQSFEVLECTAADDSKKFEIIARGGIGNVILTTHSDVLIAKGMPEEVDLMNLDASQQELLTQLGFKVAGLWKNPDKMAFVDLAKVFENIDGEGTHEFTMVVKDKLTKVTAPITLIATTKAVKLDITSATNAKVAYNYTDVVVEYTGVDFANKVTFEVYNGTTWEKCEISNVSSNGTTYSARLSIPDGMDDVTVRANYCGMERDQIIVKRDAPKLALQDYNIWATRAIIDVTELPASIPFDEVEIYLAEGDGEYKLHDNITRNASANQITLNGLTPGVEYSIKYYPSLAFTSESALQVGNAGFEDWSEYDWAFKHNGSLNVQSSPMRYYKPWKASASDIWWDSNTKTSLVSSLTIGYTFFKCFPLVHYSTDAHSGKRSAQLTVVNVGNYNSTSKWGGTNGTWYVGEMLIGKGNDGAEGSWARTSEGHAFASRPTSVSFWYEYAPYTSSDTFSAELWVKAADGTVIATASLPNGGSASSWKKVELPLNYTVLNKKAASIYIAYKASTSSSHNCDAGGHWLEIAGSKGSGDPYRIKLSATLRVDDIQLNY